MANDLLLEDINNRGNIDEDLFASDVALRNISSSYNSNFEPIVFTGETGVGESTFDKKGIPFTEISNLNEIRAQRQPWISKVGAGLGRVALKVGAEVAKMPGILGGVIAGTAGQIGDAISGEDNTDFIKTAFDNAWIQSITNFEDLAKEEGLPVYVRKAVKEGNLWDNITSIDFWATEGADGIGYIVSMLAPGAAINKFGVGAKILGTNKYAQMAAKSKYADDILKNLKRIDSPLTPTSAKNADLFTGTMANTLFEAGAEAKGAMDSYESSLQSKLDNDEITSKQFDELLKRSSEIGRNVFLSNAAILIGPNAMMSKMIWGKARNKGINVASDTGKLQLIANPTLRQKASKGVQSLIKGSITEGLWEEGMQSTVESYYTENPNSNGLDIIGDLPKAYADMFTSTDGQKAMFLGALFGGVMNTYSDITNSKKERNKANQLINSGNEVLDDAYNIFHKDIYEKNEEGNIIFTKVLENGEYKQVPKVDYKALSEKIKSANKFEYLSGLYDFASEAGDLELLRDIKHKVFTDLIKPFIVNEELGISVLKQHLEASSELASLNEKDKVDNKKFIEEILEQAKKLEKDNTNFQSFAPSIFNLKNSKATVNDKVKFYNDLADSYLNNKSNRYYTEQKLSEKENTFNTLLQERGLNSVDIENNPAKLRDLGIVDSRITKVNKEILSLKTKLENTKKTDNSFWDNESVSKEYDRYIKEVNKFRNEQSKIEEDTNSVLDNIKKATTIEELDNIDIPDNVPSEILKQNIDDKRKEIQAKISENSAKISEKSEEFTKEELQKQLKNEEAFNDLSNNFNVGETVTVPDVKSIPENRRGVSAEITAIEKGHISFKTPDGLTFAFNPSTFAGAINTSNFVTEGPVEDSIEEVQEDSSAQVYEEKNQPRIVITDNNKGDKLDFVSEGALEFERTPRDKTGEEKGIELNKGNNSNQTQKADIEKRRQEELNLLSVSDIEEFLISRKILSQPIGENAGEKNTISNAIWNILGKNMKGGNLMISSVGKEGKGRISFENLKQAIINTSDNDYQIDKIFDMINQIYKTEGISPSYDEDKINDKYDAELASLKSNNISKSNNFSENQNRAIEVFNNKDFSDIEFLINHLPLNVKLTDSVSAPLENKSDNLEAYNKIFNKTSKELKTTIVKELAKGTKIEDITVPIAGQGNGTLQLEDNVVENLITGLYEFSGDITKITNEDIYFVDNFGTLVNVNDDILPAKRPLAKGEVYIKIHTAAGLPFPLKLNIKRLTEDKAELLYELYKNRFNGEENNTLSSLDEELWNNIQVNFKDVLDLLNKNINDITIKDLIEFLVWEGSKNPKTQVKFTTKNTLLLFDKELGKEEFNTPESKNLFIYTLTQNKRHQIKFRRKENDSNDLNIDENRAYLEYLITSGTLNTNAKIGEPTFQGKTTMYLGKDQVKVKGKLSEFNEDLVKVYKTKVAKPKSEVKPEEPKKENSSAFKGVEITDKDQVDALSELFGPPSSVKKSDKKETSNEVNLKEETEFSKLSDKDAAAVYVKLAKNYSIHLKEIQAVAKKHNKIQDKAEAVFNLLKNKNISEREIKTKCGL